MSFLNQMIRHRSAKISDRYTNLWSYIADANYPNSKILSYGCGLGEECFSIAKHFPNSIIKGVDIQEKTIKKALSKNTNPNIIFEISNYNNLLKDDPYDIIFAMNVFKIIKITQEELCRLYPLSVFESQIFDLIKLLKHDGLLVIDGSSYSIEQTSIYKSNLIEIDCPINKLWQTTKGKNCVFRKI